MIRVTRYETKESGCMLGLLDMELDIDLAGEPATIKIENAKLMVRRDDGSEWVSLPSTSRTIGGQVNYSNPFSWGDRAQSDRFSEIVLAAIDEFRAPR